MSAPEGGDQNRSIEGLLHPQSLQSHRFGNGAEAVFALAVDKIDEGSLVDPDTEFLLKHDVLADGTQNDALALRFQMECVAGSELQAIPKRLRNDASGLIEGELICHNGILEKGGASAAIDTPSQYAQGT